MKILIAGSLLALITACNMINTNGLNYISVEDKFTSIRHNTPMLVDFLNDFPKGADLHNHASGAAYIEYALIDAAEKGYYYDVEELIIIKEDVSNENKKFKKYDEGSVQRANGNCSGWMKERTCLIAVNDLLRRTKDLQNYLDVVSIRGWHKNSNNGQDHFFNAFEHADVPSRKNQYLANIIARNHSQGIRYIEIMTSSVDYKLIIPLYDLVPQESFSIKKINDSYQKIKPYLDSSNFEETVKFDMDNRENAIDNILHNQYGITIKGNTPDIVVRYIPQLYRLRSLHSLFINAAANMKASKFDERIVAVNMVQNESAIAAMVNFSDQMKIFDFFWEVYNRPNIVLHAGELVLRESPLEPMRNRISQSIVLGHASRIGHGITIGWESNTERTLTMMLEKQIAIEICLSSNEIMLGVSGNDHPLLMYKNAGVPITLATDDEAISRSNLTMEYVKAAQEHNLSYQFLKKIAKNGLQYSYLGGKAIYSNDGNVLNQYRKFLSGKLPDQYDVGTKAYLQIRHERDIASFERKILNNLYRSE